MDPVFLGKYKTGSTRLKGYDYGSEGAYFITICVKNKKPLFGNIINNKNNPIVKLSELGEIACKNWIEIEKFHPYAIVDHFIVMPDHIHGIIALVKNNNTKPDLSFSVYKNIFGPQSKNIPSIIRGYKSSVKSFALKNNFEFEWQPGYYDRIIRNEKELESIQNYIYQNPLKWHLEKYYPENFNF